MARVNDVFWPISRQPKDLVDAIDKYLKGTYIKKSEFTRQALINHLKFVSKKTK